MRQLRLLGLLAALGPSCLGPLGGPDPADEAPLALSPDLTVLTPTPAIAEVRVTDASGRAWSLADAPRRPRVELRWTRPVVAEEAPLLLLSGPPDADLAEDLRALPLRRATEDRVLDAVADIGPTAWTLRPTGRLAPGGAYTLAVAGPVRDPGRGERLPTVPPFTLSVSRSADAGAAAVASWPPDGAAGVPPSVRRVAVRFDGAVDGGPDALAVLGPRGRHGGRSAPVACAAIGWPDGACVAWTPDGALAPGAAYRVELGPDLRDRTGERLPFFRATFATTAGPVPALAFLPRDCSLDERPVPPVCVLADDRSVVVRAELSAPARATLALGARSVLGLAPRGAITLAIEGLAPATEGLATLRAEGLDGRGLEATLPVATTPPLAPLSIVEVRADPLGPEPRQEYVELLNYGAMPIDIQGFTVTDRADAAGDPLPGGRPVQPGQRALVVAAAFDPSDDADPPVPSGALLLRLEGPIGTGGLANRGEPVLLRDAEGRRLSAAPALGAPGPGWCLVRTGDDPRRGREEDFAPDPAGTCTPGRPPADGR